MGKDRLAAFSDGVFAIIITIMVLELKVPHGSSWEVLAGVAPNFVSYVLSFVYLAIYWNNHHHLVHTVARVDGLILWANSQLLFWLSLIPAATAWMGENFLASIPTAVYGTSLLMPAIAYYLVTACERPSCAICNGRRWSWPPAGYTSAGRRTARRVSTRCRATRYARCG